MGRFPFPPPPLPQQTHQDVHRHAHILLLSIPTFGHRRFRLLGPGSSSSRRSPLPPRAAGWRRRAALSAAAAAAAAVVAAARCSLWRRSENDGGKETRTDRPAPTPRFLRACLSVLCRWARAGGPRAAKESRRLRLVACLPVCGGVGGGWAVAEGWWVSYSCARAPNSLEILMISVLGEEERMRARGGKRTETQGHGGGSDGCGTPTRRQPPPGRSIR